MDGPLNKSLNQSSYMADFQNKSPARTQFSPAPSQRTATNLALKLHQLGPGEHVPNRSYTARYTQSRTPQNTRPLSPINWQPMPFSIEKNMNRSQSVLPQERKSGVTAHNQQAREGNTTPRQTTKNQPL